jgi:acetyl esterase/lipase
MQGPLAMGWRTHLIVLLGALLMAAVCIRHYNKVDYNLAAQPMDDLAITRDVAYLPGGRHSLDIYAPRTPGAPRPVVIFFYGGGYDSGKKADFAWVGAALARRGYVVVMPDFRLYPQVIWPAFLQDCSAAVRWTHDNIASYGGDPSELVLMGHSSGAYNAISLAVDRRWLEDVGMDPGRDLRAAVGLSGPYDDLPATNPTTNRKVQTIFGPKSQWPDTQPVNHADGRSPPLLLITGDRDDIVDPVESDILAANVRKSGGMVTLIHYPTLDHAGTLYALAPQNRKSSQVMDDITAFISAARTAAAN